MDGSSGELMELYKVIVDEILTSNERKIAFSRFMDLALYHPTRGYYMKEKPKLGKSGDFFTNVHVGDVFGGLLSHFFLQLVPHRSDPWSLIEMGAGDGRLMEQVCKGLIEAQIDPMTVHLYLIEASPYHRKVQQERLRGYPFTITWVPKVSDIPAYPFSIIYSNELVDAFPIHRMKRINEEEIVEIYVTVEADTQQLIETYGPISDVQIETFIDGFECSIDVQQSFEVNMKAKEWIEGIAKWMKNGYVLTIDYGATTRELLFRKEGTLRYYYKHMMPENCYKNPGEVDITCHVNFEALQRWGKEVGLESVFFSTQRDFLLQSGILDCFPDSNAQDPFSSEGKKKREIQQLIHPDAMGESFRVLLQKK